MKPRIWHMDGFGYIAACDACFRSAMDAANAHAATHHRAD